MSENFSLIYEPQNQNVYNEKGYHATLKEYGESIKINGFKPSNNEDDWLGEGVYFWDNIKNAKWWMYSKKLFPQCIILCGQAILY